MMLVVVSASFLALFALVGLQESEARHGSCQWCGCTVTQTSAQQTSPQTSCTNDLHVTYKCGPRTFTQIIRGAGGPTPAGTPCGSNVWYSGLRTHQSGRTQNWGTCNGGGTCMPPVPSPSVSVNPTSPTSSDMVVINVGANGFAVQSAPWAPPAPVSSITSVRVYLDGSLASTCSGSGSGRACRTFYDPAHSWTRMCYATPGGGSCQVTAGPLPTGTHTYTVSATDSYGQTGTRSGSFEVIPACNNNGVCNAGEDSSSCPADCDASCTSDGICGVREPLTCADCSSCDKDGVCEAGEAGVCPVDCPADFSIALDPTKGIVNKGDKKDVNVSVSLLSGTTSPVSISASGLPAGTTATFSPTSCSPNCYSNATITTTASTPDGYHNITIVGVSGLVTKGDYYNLTVLPSGVPATCGNAVCEYPETQSSCPSDCKTTASIPSPVSPGDTVTVSVEFFDFRYYEDGKVKIDLLINPEGTAWTPLNGCFFGGKKMGPGAGADGTIAWPPGTVSEDGHFRISTTCTLPSTITAGAHTLVATPTIF